VTNDGAKPPVARLLKVGAKRAGRVAQATGVNQALDEAVEEAIVRALRSPAIGRAIERAMEDRAATMSLDADQVAGMVKQVLESESAERVWDEVRASEQAQMLVERIAGAPETGGHRRAERGTDHRHRHPADQADRSTRRCRGANRQPPQRRSGDRSGWPGHTAGGGRRAEAGMTG
jgi:hypothetical protein